MFIDKSECKLALALDKLVESQRLSEETRKLMNSICEVGSDIHIHPKSDNSWAVICVHGKIDYVKFVQMNQSNIREIASFLKHFEYSNQVIDTSMKWSLENIIF